MKITKIISALFLSTLMLVSFTACGDPGNGDGGDNGGGGHEHEYSNGICSCGEVDYTHVTEGIIYEAVDGGYEVVNYVGTATTVVIPLTHEGEKVVSIGVQAFEGLSQVKRVYMSENVVEIKEKAFYSCMGLKTIQIGKGVKTIGYQCVAECLDLSKILFDAVDMDATPYDNLTFMHSGSNTRSGLDDEGITLIVNKCVTNIPEAFMYYGSSSDRLFLRHVVFEDNSECLEIGNNAFAQQRDLVSINFGANSKLEKIGQICFSNCVSLRAITIPASVKVIGRKAFNNFETISQMTVEDPEGWHAIKYNGDSEIIEDVVITKEQMQDLLNQRLTFNDYFYTKVTG